MVFVSNPSHVTQLTNCPTGQDRDTRTPRYVSRIGGSDSALKKAVKIMFDPIKKFDKTTHTESQISASLNWLNLL
jgi:hypothetical protein